MYILVIYVYSSCDIYNTTVEPNQKSLPDVFSLIWYLERSDSKNSLTTSFAITYDI